MDAKDLETRIAERKKEAEKAQIIGKARCIARGLGTGGHRVEGKYNDEIIEYSYKDRILHIEDSFIVLNSSDGPAMGGHTKITYLGKVVFHEAGGKIESYVPGYWERRLTKLSKEADSVLKDRRAEELEKKKRETEKKITEDKAKWGL